MSPLDANEREILAAVAEAALPAGQLFPAAGEATVKRTEAFLATLSARVARGFRGALAAIEHFPLLTDGRRFSQLPLGRRLRALERWNATDPGRLGLRALLAPLKLVHFDDPSLHAALGCRYVIDPPRAERPRWRDQVTDAATLTDGEELTCDAVVVGTGAGGAPVARSLAERGHAVLLVEEGELHSRTEFNGRPVEMMRKLYRRGGATFALGNTLIPIPVGRAVGGTTLINAGTCFRVPESTLAEWREKLGLDEFTPELLAPHYEVVERELGVAPSPPKVVGKPGELIARGCDALGYSHFPLRRNAPGCDGQGVCCFGCPSDAKRSTNISFVPQALERGAQLLTGFKVERVLVENDRAVGVVGRAHTPEGARRITIRARVVVLACGALHTPALLLANRLANASGEVGKNLSIHPASAALALFDEQVNGWNSVPQGYAIDAFAHEGIMFEGASVPLDLTAVSIPAFGPGLVSLMERFDRTLTFGFMVKDTSRGRVRLGAQGEPLITYWMNGHDLRRMQRAMGILARVFFAAGAREVHVPLAGHERLRDLDDVAHLERGRIAARHLDITAYHPLGTARMGRDPLRSVVDTTHETHDVHNLFICDGSSVPGSLGVNPQMTIMAMALRAAQFIDRRLHRLDAMAA